MNRSVIFVVKHEFTTRFMRDADLFEPFKFVGRLVEASQAPSHHHLTAHELLERSKFSAHGYTVVGVIIPNGGAAFLPNHRVWSNGQHWATVEDLCHGYQSKLES